LQEIIIMKHLVLALGAALALAAPGAAQTPPPAGQAADVTGKWDVTVVTQQGTIASVLVLRKDGDKLLGTITSQEYGENAVEAEVKDKDVAIYFTIQIQNNPLNIAFYGTAQGDTMKGTADLGEMGSLDWSAKRAAAPTAAPATQAAPTPPPAAKIDLTGTWNLQVNTEAGSGTPTVIFKQDGEKLTGQYSGQFGESSFTGTLKGSDLRFEFDVSAEGNTVHIVYAGTVDKDTMKGSVKFGDLGEGTFTGKKK
jgi:invasion protein IalB